MSDFITFLSTVWERGGSGQVFQAVKVQFDLHRSPTLAVHQSVILTGDKVQALSRTPGRVRINVAGQPHSNCKKADNEKAGVRRCSCHGTMGAEAMIRQYLQEEWSELVEKKTSLFKWKES